MLALRPFSKNDLLLKLVNSQRKTVKKVGSTQDEERSLSVQKGGNSIDTNDIGRLDVLDNEITPLDPRSIELIA